LKNKKPKLADQDGNAQEMEEEENSHYYLLPELRNKDTNKGVNDDLLVKQD